MSQDKPDVGSLRFFAVVAVLLWLIGFSREAVPGALILTAARSVVLWMVPVGRRALTPYLIRRQMMRDRRAG